MPLRHAQPKPLRELIFGDAVIHGSDPVASDVLFFGHKSESQWARYRRITAKSYETAQEQTYTLHTSESHFLPVAGRGEVPACLVTVGDKRFTDDGSLELGLAIEEHMMKGL
ncbi:hypothetical protein FGB62_114g15 [Gracilaria domingensis]|nr:hypothetical protein FGB62_114g15 [Gracilaria domingensis]